MSDQNSERRRIGFLDRYGARIVFAGALILYVAVSLRSYLGAGRDDVFITLWAGENLARGLGFVNHNFERVEIASSLFHTIVIAVFARIAPGHVFTLNKLVGLCCGCAALGVIHGFRRPLFGEGRPALRIYAVVQLLIATNPTFLYWNLGGLETPFAMLVLTGYGALIAAHWERPRPGIEAALAFAASLYLTIRPEGFFLVLFAAVYAALLTWLRGGGRRVMVIAAIPAAVFGLLTLWRYAYFEQLFPNPVYAKAGALSENIASGVAYAGYFFGSSLLLICALAVLLLLAVRYGFMLWLAVDPDIKPQLLTYWAPVFPFGLVVAACLTVVFCGGDWMEYFRFFAPIVPLLILVSVRAAGDAMGWCWARIGNPRARRVLCAIAAYAAGLLAVSSARQSDLNVPRSLPWEIRSNAGTYILAEVFGSWADLDRRLMMTNNDHARELTLVPPFLDTQLPLIIRSHDPLVIAMGQMGIIPYLIKQRFPGAHIRFIDHLGLCDRAVAALPLAKDQVGVARGKFVDEILAGETPILSGHILAQRPHLAHMLAYPPDMPERIARLERAGYRVVYDAWPEVFFYNPSPPGR